MLIELRINNCLIFNKPVVISLRADMRSKKFSANVHQINQFHIVKTIGIFGQNNAGKTSLIKCLRRIKSIFLNKKPLLMPNFFTDNSVCELGITFLSDEKQYAYDFKYDARMGQYTYEYFREISLDEHGNTKEIPWLKKDSAKDEYDCIDAAATKTMPDISNNNLVCYLINTDKFPHLEEMKQHLQNFANKILFLDMNNIPIEHTIRLLKNPNHLQKKIVNFVKNADLYLDDLVFLDSNKIRMESIQEGEPPAEDVLALKEKFIDQIRLTSVYRKHPVPSLFFDSTGTKKITALASYIIEALQNGNILVIDELDSSLHFRLTRSIVALFNNELNDMAQLIFSAHDVNLIDCKHLFRKDQIWFVHKDMEQVYIYSLANYTARDGIRSDSDILEKYKQGIMGAVPEPDLIKSLLEIKRPVAKKSGEK